ncbi:MAG: glycosyltransferase [Opitutaceae bacterium]|jgi:GT2 family glycosyltransferase/glycosyltransferase involved in cell wall biosynthesis
MPPVTIVIPVHNDAATLLACVRAVFKHTDHPDWKLLVVDDGSTDGGPAALRAAFPDVAILAQKRAGVARALNAGFNHPLATGRDVVRLHADVVVETPGWLGLLAETATSRPGIGAVGPRLVYPDGRIQSEGRHFVSGLGLHPRHCNLRAYLADGPAGPVAEVDAVAGALAYYRRDALAAVGGLDERYGPVWMEDDDFCIAARHRGFKVLVHPGVRAVHYTRCAGPVFQAKVIGSDKALSQVTRNLKETAGLVQAARWQAKWGWDPHYPDTNEIRRLHGATEVTWKIGEALRYTPKEACPPVDCCLVTWNSLKLLKRTLETLALTEYPADRLRVYVADNGSTDATPAYLAGLQADYPFRLHIITLPLNTGVAAGINAAILAGSAELVARLDDDISLQPDWLKVFVEDLRNRPFAGCVATKTINDNTARTLQWACPHSYPNGYNYRDETNRGQADYLARVAAIHGCCILYRRDTIKRCGVFDIRYSPTQYDDIDHNFALVQAGYEVLYDGRTHVVHKISTGLDRSFAGMASAAANGAKMYGKWGHDIFERLDSAIVLSREGRYLPDDGDTSAWLATGPQPAEFPRSVPALSPGHLKILDDIYLALCPPDGADGALRPLAKAFLKRGRQLISKGFFMDALDVFLTASNFMPSCPEVFAALSGSYHRLGYTDQAHAAARRGLHLDPENAELAELSLRPSATPPVAEPAHADEPVIETGPRPLRVLMVNAFQPRLPDDDVGLMQALAAALRGQGVHVEESCTARPDPTGFDLVHVWNTGFPYQTLSQLNAIRVASPKIPICLTPLYEDKRESAWGASALGVIFGGLIPPAEMDVHLRTLARGFAPVSGEARPTPRNVHLYFGSHEACQQKLVQRVDHLLPASAAELADLQRELSVQRPHTLLPLPVAAERLRDATPEWFHEHYPQRDFVLTVGGLDPQKNQLMLMQALRGTNLPLVVVGHHRNSDYTEFCLRHASPDVLFIEHLEPDQLASVFKAARVYAAPSWQECRFSPTLEAAVAGCSLVVSQRPAEKEYFGAAAHLCNPADTVSIRNAVISAHRSHALTSDRRQALSVRIAQLCDAGEVAGKLLEVYRHLAPAAASRIRECPLPAA